MKKTSKDPVRAYAINLSNKSNDYKIEKIENLEQFCELRQLNLSYNRICKISGLSTLCQLTVLNLSHNCLVSLNGIQSLSNLLVLKVNNNQITSIPKWLPKRLPKLKTIHFHYNQIDTLHQITYLRSLSNLTVFTFEGNPAVNQLIINTNNSSSSDEAAVRNTIEKFDAQSLCRIFIIFHLCSLILLDNREVLPFERQVAEQRFSQVEISRYLNKLNTYESQLKEVETKNSLLKKDLSHEQSQLSETLHKRKLESDLISHLEEELHAKDKLLHLKSEELARACLKHFELEQQLAFHKIDEKLGLVGSCLSKPRRNSSYVHQVPDTGDQPYLGKCMFKYTSTNNSINDHSVENKCPSDNHLINIQNKMCSNINDHSDCHKSYLNCLDNKLENNCHDNIHENSNVTHQYSSDIVPPINGNQELNPELDRNLISLNNQFSHLPQSDPPPNRSSPTGELFLDKVRKSPTLDKPLDDVKSSDLLEEKTSTRSSTQPENKVIGKSFKQSDVEQIQMKLSKLQSELVQLRIKESTIQNNTVYHNNSNINDNNNPETNELNNRIKILESELNQMWTMAHLLKSESNQNELTSRNNITTNNVYLNSFVTLPKSSSDRVKHANLSKSDKNPKYFSYEFSRQNSPHQKRERRFSLPSKDIDLKQILSGDNFNHVNGTTSVGSEFDSCEEFVDSPRKLINSSKKKESHQFTLSHDRCMGSVTPSTPSSRTTGTGRSALLSMHTPRSNDLYTMDHLSKPFVSVSARNTLDHSRKNLHNDVHESNNSCIPCESTTMQANIHNTQDSVPNIQLERTRGSGVGGPLPLTNASQPSSFDSFQLYSYTANSNEDNNNNNNDNNNNNQSSENSDFQKSDNFRRYHISRLPKPNPTRTLSRGSDLLQFNSDQAWPYNRKSRKLSSKCRSYRNFSRLGSCVRAKWSKQKHKQPRSRSVSHKSEKNMSDSNNSSQNYSLSDHAEELLNLIVMSRDACSMEVDRIREDLSRLYKADSKRQTHLDHKKQSGKQHGLSLLLIHVTLSTINNRLILTILITFNLVIQIYVDCVRPMRNHVDSLKTRYSPAGDDNDDCSFTECQPTVYQKAQSLTNYHQYPSESNNNNSNDKNLNPNHSQYKPHTRRLLPHTKSFDDYDGFDLNDHQLDSSNHNNDDFCAADNNYNDQMNYFYHRQDYKRQNEPPVNFKDHWLPNGVQDLNWNNDQKNSIRSSSNRRPTSLHKSRVFSRRPRTRSIPRQHPINANFSPYHNNTYRRFSRGHSLDYTHQHLKQSALRNSATSLLNDIEYHDVDPTSETEAIIHLTDELFGLRQGLKRTREANSERLEVALRHISLLELELQRQRCLNHDAEVARQREVERTRWEKRLAATLNELKYCQIDIGKLREQVDQLESSKKITDQSELKLELDQTKATLDAQKEEITTLNNLLNSLLGLNPNDVSPNDLQRLQVGLLDLHKHMQPDCANQYCHYQRQQHVPNPIHPRQTLYRTQSLMTGLTGVPANERMNKVDWLNSNNTAPPITQSSGGNHQLYCNVPEHHDLEDCLGQLQYKIEELYDQHETTQNKLRHNMKIRRKLECQLEEQDSILNRLKSELMSCQEDLKIAKQDVTRLSCEKEAAQKSKHDQLAGIVTDLATLEATVSQRRTELTTLDTNIQDSDQQLSIIKAQAKEAVSKYEEAKREYDNVKSQLDMIRSEKSLADENLEQLRTKLSNTKLQVERLESNKSNLENQLTQLEDAVNAKKLEYNQLLPNLSELETRKIRVVGFFLASHNLSSTETLNPQIEEDKLRLELLAQDTEAKKSELELIKAEKRRELENSNSIVRELANQTAIKQRELNETQTSLNASLDEKERILQSVKTLRLERDNIRTALEQEQKISIFIYNEVLFSNHKLLLKTMCHQLVCEKYILMVHQKVQLHDSISEANLTLARIKAESESASNLLRQKNIECNAALADCDRMFKQTSDSRDELNIAQQRLQKANDLKQSIESSLNEQRRQRVLLSDELNHLEEAVHTGRLAKQLADESREASEEALKSAVNKLNKMQTEKKLLEETYRKRPSSANRMVELDSLRMSKDNELHYLNERLHNTRQHLESVESELSQKSLKLNEVSEKLNTLQNEYIKKEQTKSNSPELEKELEKCKQQQVFSRLDDRNKQLTYSHQFNELKIDNMTKLHDKINNNNLLQALMDTKSALIAAQRESKRLKRRTAREVAELERVAEEQCNRAGDLTEQLSLAKRQYAQLKSQIATYGILMDEVITIASQTELTEHGKRLEAALSAVRAELEQHNNTMNASVVDENGCSNSTLFGQRIREVLNPDSDSRIVKDRSSNDQEIQEITDHNYSANGLQKSLLLLTNSFHEISHSPSNFHSVQSLTDSLNGLCKKSNHFSYRLFPNNDSEHVVDDPELNYTTSGLGSSVNPGTQIASNGGSVQENSTILSPSTLGESKPVKSNNWKQNVSSGSVGRQRSHDETAPLATSGFVNHSRTSRHFKSGSSRSSRPG
uniref:Centriolin n=1 Tax=Schistosoma haematobium TaxID=6185 RepID=A0A094ZKH9_SCHHA